MARYASDRLIILIALIPFLSIASARAMSVEPMLLEFSSSGKKTQNSFSVSNSGSRPLPIEISVSGLEIGFNGEIRKTPGKNEFLIYPPQAIVPPGGTQVFRVHWIGSPDLSTSHTYQLSVSQVPVALAKGQSGIQVAMSFGITANVAPLDAKAALTVSKTEPVISSEGKRQVALTVKNSGTKHAYLSRSAITLSGKGWSSALTSSAVSQHLGVGIVQPGKERNFLIPLDVPPGVTQISATLDYRPEE